LNIAIRERERERVHGSHLSSQLRAEESTGLRHRERCRLEAKRGGRLLKQRTLLLLMLLLLRLSYERGGEEQGPVSGVERRRRLSPES
jgi:hypothetical protein